MSQPLEPEILDNENDETEETDAEYLEPTICQTGYNTSVIVTPVKCSECGRIYYIVPDTLDDEQFCLGCGVEFTAHDSDF